MRDSILQLENFKISEKNTPHVLVHPLSLTLNKNKVALVGGSGSGKTLTARALLNLLPDNLEITARSWLFKGQSMQKLSKETWRSFRGRKIAMILQDARSSFNPIKTIGQQMLASYRYYFALTAEDACERGLALLKACAFSEPKRVWHAYPHELSGGMAQRAMIALMLIGKPDLLIADEPTSGLDAVIRTEILKLLNKLSDTQAMHLLIITHDLKLAQNFCDEILVMHQGHLIEHCASQELINSPQAYIQKLLDKQPI